MVNETHPTFGIDATGENTYTEVVASPRGARDNENKEYTELIASCATNDAVISLDGGTTDNIRVVAGNTPIHLKGLKITQAIHGKNADSGSNYADLVINVQP